MKTDPEILVLTNDEDKKCARCGRILPATHFYRKESAPDKRQSWCIECQKEYRRLMAALHPKKEPPLNVELERLLRELYDAKGKKKSALKILKKYIKLLEKQLEIRV